jgi:hypothetical protein
MKQLAMDRYLQVLAGMLSVIQFREILRLQ